MNKNPTICFWFAFYNLLESFSNNEKKSHQKNLTYIRWTYSFWCTFHYKKHCGSCHDTISKSILCFDFIFARIGRVCIPYAYQNVQNHRGRNIYYNVLSIVLNSIYRQRNLRKSLEDILSSTFITAVSTWYMVCLFVCLSVLLFECVRLCLHVCVCDMTEI